MTTFKIGDKAIVKSVGFAMHGYAVGDKVTVTGFSHSDRLEIQKLGTESGYCYPNEIELVKEFSVGDIVKGISDHYGITDRDMTKGEVTRIYPGGDIDVKVLEMDNGFGAWVGNEFKVEAKYFELVTPTPKFKSGDRVKSKALGSEYVLSERRPANDSTHHGIAWGIEGDVSWIGENQVELVEQPTLKAGDKAKVTEMSPPMLGFKIGDIVTIVETEGTGQCPVKIQHEEGYTGYTDLDKLESVREEEAKKNETEAVDVATDYVISKVDGLDVTGGKKYEVVNRYPDREITIIDDAGDHHSRDEGTYIELEEASDYVIATEDGMDVTEGKLYKVTERHSDGSVEIIDDEGDEQYMDTEEFKELLEWKSPAKQESTKYVRMVNDDPADGYEAGDIFKVEGDSFIDNDGDERPLSAHKHTFVNPSEEPANEKRFIEMTAGSFGYRKGDVLPVSEDGDYFTDSDGDIRPMRSHRGNYKFITLHEKPTTKNDVVDYLRKLSAEEILSIVEEARK